MVEIASKRFDHRLDLTARLEYYRECGYPVAESQPLLGGRERDLDDPFVGLR